MIKVYYINKTVSIPKLQIKHVNFEMIIGFDGEIKCFGNKKGRIYADLNNVNTLLKINQIAIIYSMEGDCIEEFSSYPLKNENGAMIAAPVFIFVPEATINPLCGIWSVRNNAFVYRYAKYT